MQTTSTDRIWMIILSLIILLTVAGAVRSLAASPEETYATARQALNSGRWRVAAEHYRQLYHEYAGAYEAAEARYWEAFALYRSGEASELRRAVRALEEQLELHPDAETSEDGEELLARLYGEMAERGDADAARRLHEMTDDERQTETKVAALQALMTMDEERALPILKKILEDPGTDDDLRRHSVYLFARIEGDEAEQTLIRVLDTTDDPELRTELVFWLAHRGGDRALDAVVKAYRESDDAEMTEAVMHALGRFGDERARDLLVEIARDEGADPEHRAHALHALVHAGSSQSADLIVQIFRSTGDDELKEVCLYSLSRLDGDVPGRVFMELIEDPSADDELRAQALHFAARRGAVDLDFVTRVYRQAEDTELKEQVCWVLAEMESDEALEALIGIVRNEDDPEVRQQAVFWVGRFDNERAAEFLLELIRED